MSLKLPGTEVQLMLDEGEPGSGAGPISSSRASRSSTPAGRRRSWSSRSRTRSPAAPWSSTRMRGATRSTCSTRRRRRTARTRTPSSGRLGEQVGRRRLRNPWAGEDVALGFHPPPRSVAGAPSWALGRRRVMAGRSTGDGVAPHPSGDRDHHRRRRSGGCGASHPRARPDQARFGAGADTPARRTSTTRPGPHDIRSLSGSPSF